MNYICYKIDHSYYINVKDLKHLTKFSWFFIKVALYERNGLKLFCLSSSLYSFSWVGLFTIL